MKYLKTYTGVTSGTMAGREDGFPETKIVTYNDFASLAKDFGKKSEERYYELTELNVEELIPQVATALETLKEHKKQEKKESIEKQIAKLQQELKNLG